jgi:hypothetical protein
MTSIYTIGDRIDLGYPVNLDADGKRYALGTYATLEEAWAAIDINAAEYAVTDYIVTDANA